jgi:hypothetical protein
MKHLWILGLLLLPSTATFAQEADAGSLIDEIDAAALQEPAAIPAAPAQTNPVLRAFQSLNPDISIIADLAAGIGRETPYSLAGDDPDLMGGPDNQPAGVTVQELEFAFSAVVDPYLRANIYLTIPNLSGVEVEEAFATSTSLPAGFQLKAGIFRSAFGRQNTQHLHVQDFTRRPLINEAYLGADGLRSPGLQVSWLAPTPFFLQLTAEAFSVGPPEGLEHLTTFGGGKRTDLTYTGGLRTFIPAADSLSFFLGANVGVGKTAGIAGEVEGVVLHEGATSVLSSFDLYVKLKPANQTGGYFSVAWTTEVFLRQVLARDDTEVGLFDAGLYSQLVVQVARRWFLGLRQDLLGLVKSDAQPQVNRTSLSVTFAASEFARVRAYVERESLPTGPQLFFEGRPNWAGYLQLEFAIGAHGGHSF